jgi:hypothetical protein
LFGSRSAITTGVLYVATLILATQRREEKLSSQREQLLLELAIANDQNSRIGRVLITRGWDAVDAAISTLFGPSELNSFRVWTDEVVE